MTKTRRHMLTAFFGTAVVLPVEPLLSWLQGAGPGVKAKPYPNGRSPDAPPRLDDPTTIDRKAIEMEHRKELRANVARLYDMVVELKEQVDKLDVNSTFSIPVMKKTQQIEKLAKQIKNLAKG